MEAGTFARAVRASVAEGALATVMGTLLGGVYLTAFALQLGASELQIGLLAATTSLANFAQLGGSWAIERLGHRKQLCMIATWMSRLLWLPMLLVPYVCTDSSKVQQVWYIVVLLILSSMFASVGGLAWLSWIKELVPSDLRLRFLGRRHVFNTALAFGLSVVGGLFVDAWTRTRPDSLGGFVTVFAAAMSCGIVGLFILQTIPDAPPTRPAALPLAALVRRPLADRNFRRLIGFYAAWNFASNLATPFFAVYMLTVLQLSFATVTLLLTLSSVTGVIATRMWTRIGDRFGTRTMVQAASLVDAVCPLLWLLVSPDSLWLLVPIHLLGVVAAPIAMGPSVLPLKHSPPEYGSIYLALFSAITGPITAAGAVTGGLIAGWDAAGGASATLTGLRLIFILSAIGRFASLLLLRSVNDPESTSVRRMVRVAHRTGRRWTQNRRRRLQSADGLAKAA